MHFHGFKYLLDFDDNSGSLPSQEKKSLFVVGLYILFIYLGAYGFPKFCYFLLRNRKASESSECPPELRQALLLEEQLFSEFSLLKGMGSSRNLRRPVGFAAQAHTSALLFIMGRHLGYLEIQHSQMIRFYSMKY